MSEYQDPIRIRQDDPICSATAMNGTIVGILFEKTGSEIKTAIGKRLEAVNAKISEHQTSVSDVDEFLKKKEKDLEEIEKVYTERADEKKAKMKPFERDIEDIRKKVEDISFQFNRETEKKVAEKAVGFQEGFKDIEGKFDDIDKLLEEDEIEERTLSTRSMTKSGRYRTITDNVGIGINNPDLTLDPSSAQVYFNFTEAEDKALSQVETLKKTVSEYRRRVKIILRFIRNLIEEKRRLELIRRHLKDDFNYKLDLNKLSAFGFEDIEVDG